MKDIQSIVPIIVLAFATACGGAQGEAGGARDEARVAPEGDPSAEPAAEPDAEPLEASDDDPALVVHNASQQTVCFVFFASTGEPTTTDRLDDNEVVDPGTTRGWRVPAGAYDIRLAGCEHEPLLDRRAVPVEGDGVLVTYQ